MRPSSLPAIAYLPSSKFWQVKATAGFRFSLIVALATAGILVLLSSCATSRHSERSFSKKVQKEVEHSPVFNRAFTGFTLLDPATGKTLADVNGDKYFTPASNTKILTLATCLEVLEDSVPGMVWWNNNYYGGSVGIRPIGDPTFLHPKFQSWQFIFKDLQDVASKGKRIYIDDWYNNKSLSLGPGWAWDDADYDYSAEITFFPMYGNLKRLSSIAPDSLLIEPPYWQGKLIKFNEITNAHMEPPFWLLENNEIMYGGSPVFKPDFEKWIPVQNSSKYWKELLADTLKVDKEKIESGGDTERRIEIELPIRYSCPMDTVLRRMMHQSDNFIAEQMLLVCAGYKFQIFHQDTMIKWMLDSVLTGLPQRPRWVDGSGLSRYNLISPQDLAQVLLKLWKEQPHEYLLSLFPAGGMNGTVSDWYRGKDGKPCVFAKTGGMSGVHCLSGYVVTRRGKILIFSFMHNNFIGSNKPWKQEMQRILELIREQY